MSSDAFARIMPVIPPTVNRKINPTAQRRGASKRGCAP